MSSQRSGDLQGDSELTCDMWGSHIDDGASPDPSGVVNTVIPGRTSRLLDLNGDGGADVQFFRMLDQTTDFVLDFH